MLKARHVCVLFLFAGIFALPATAIERCGVDPNLCPSGYHAVDYRCDSKCSGVCSSTTHFNNLTVCQPDTPPSFTKCFHCQPGCPTGYDWHSATNNAVCEGPTTLCFGPVLSGNQVTCEVPPPTLTYSGGEGASCGDMGTAHPSPGYLVKYTVTGRPGALVWKYDLHASCAGAQWQLAPESPLTIPSSGVVELVIPNQNPIFDCNHPNLGRYRSYVIVDGKQSNFTTFNYYNSTCPAVDTCAEAGWFCP